MRVALLGNYRADNNMSMLGFEKALAERLPKHGVDIESLWPKPVFGGRARSRAANKWLGYVDKFVLFPRVIREKTKHVDLVHLCDQGDSLWISSLRDRRHLVTCHDLLAVRAARGEIADWTVRSTGKKLQAGIIKNLAEAQFIACDSAATRDDVVRITGRTNDLDVVELGLIRDIPRLDAATAANTLGTLAEQAQKPFLLHVGGNQHYKNRIGAVRIYMELRKLLGQECPRLLLAGLAPSAAIVAEVREGIEKGWISVLVKPSDDQILALYSLAQGLIFPSLFEGFGLPILEAQTCGCPVFTTNRPPMNEIGRDLCVYFEPEDAAGAAGIIAANWDNRWELAKAAAARAETWSVDAMVERYYRQYCQRLSNPR